jgi:two-component system, OmpR family, response regulator
MATGPLRVLVVDDNRDIVVTTIDLLTARGHQGMACHNGLEVIKCVQDFDPDVVVMDIGLPGRTGWDAAKDIRASIPGKRPLLIGLSGAYTKETDRELAAKSGFDYYLTKPVDPMVLLSLIDQWANDPAR